MSIQREFHSTAEAVEEPVRERNTNKATVRVLRVLSAFASDQPSYGVTDLSQAVGMTKNMVFRALNTLVDQGYLVHAPTPGRYELGFRVIELLNPHLREPDLREIAMPSAAKMHELTGETVRVGLRTGDTVTVIDGIRGRGPVVSRVGVGVTFPLHISPMSRAVLSALSDQEIKDYISRNSPLKAATPNTITNPDKLLEEVHLVRRQGYALGYGDLTPGVVSAAFAILDAESRPWGVIICGGPGERFTRDKLDAALSRLREIANELNRRSRMYYSNQR